MKKLLVASVIFISNIVLSQSPWVHERGNGYTHLSLGTLPKYNTVFKGDWSNLEEIDFKISEYSLQSYTEVGLGENLEAVIDVPVRYLQSESSTPDLKSGSVFGPGGTSLGLKYRLINKAVVLSSQSTVSLPLIAKKPESGLRTSYDNVSLSQTFSIGQGGDKFYWYSYTGFGWFSKLSSDVRFGAEYGRIFKERFWVMLNLSIRESLRNKASVPSVYDRTYSYVNNQTNISLALKLAYELTDKAGVNFSTNLMSFKAHNLPFQRPISLGVYKKW